MRPKLQLFSQRTRAPSKLPVSMGTRIIFITGTDTGVGKTVLTALLLCFLRRRGARALAVKPFCSGGRADAELLHRFQARDLTLDETNPFYFPEPVAPLISGRKHKRKVTLEQVVEHIRSIASRAPQLPLGLNENPRAKGSGLAASAFLLVEGSGGLLVPLGEGYTVRDLIARLNCEVVVVSRNQLGTINHSLLTLLPLERHAPGSSSVRGRPAASSVHPTKMVLMDQRSPDISSQTNPTLLQQWIGSVPLIRLPYLGSRSGSVKAIQEHAGKLQARLERILDRAR